MATDWLYRPYLVPIEINGTSEEIAEFWRNVEEDEARWRERMDREIAQYLFANSSIGTTKARVEQGDGILKKLAAKFGFGAR